MKTILIIALCVFLSSCQKFEPRTEVNIEIKLQIEDMDGVDLLIPNSNNPYSNGLPEVYTLTDEGEILLIGGQMSGYDSITGRYFYSIFPFCGLNREETITYISYNDVDIDTLVCQFYLPENKIILNTAFYNDSLIFKDRIQVITSIVKKNTQYQ